MSGNSESYEQRFWASTDLEFFSALLAYIELTLQSSRAPANAPTGQRDIAMEMMQDDVAELLRVLGLGDHARPVSPAVVMRNEVIPAVRTLVAGVRAAGGQQDELIEQLESAALYLTGMHRSDQIPQLIRRAAAELRKAPDSSATGQWRRVEDGVPETERWVLAFFVNELKKGRVIRAYYAPKLTIPADFWDDDCGLEPDTDAATGEAYVPEGWYECNEESEVNMLVNHTITHWMPLPAQPADFESQAMEDK